ncbi:MAG: ABC transporter permease [Chloroflexota bacterium]
MSATTTEAPGAFNSAAGNAGPLSLLGTAIEDIRSRRRLVRYLVQAEMKKRGSNTILGNVWWVLDPLLQMIVYVVFVTIIGRGRSIPDYPLFILSAILPWKWFTASIGDATTAVASQAQLIRQIAFPKIVLPVASATAGVVGFAWGLIPLGLVTLLYRDRLSAYILLIPVIAMVQYVFTMAVAILISAANVFARDIGNISGHFLRLWWFMSPGLYPLAALETVGFFREHPTLQTLAALNPFAVLFEAYRMVIYGSQTGPPGPPNWLSLGLLLLASLGLLAVAAIAFKRAEPQFAKVL